MLNWISIDQCCIRNHECWQTFNHRNVNIKELNGIFADKYDKIIIYILIKNNLGMGGILKGTVSFIDVILLVSLGQLDDRADKEPNCQKGN